MERIVAVVREHLADYPLQLYDIILACVEAQGLASVLDTIGEIHGNAGQRYFRIVHRKRIPYGEYNTIYDAGHPAATNPTASGTAPHLPVRTRRRGARGKPGRNGGSVQPARVRLPAVPRV
ncbi:MAG TPA: hypothetical protein VGM51_06985 [Armatimonadota bacterium]|jgi:hypothetical protein